MTTRIIPVEPFDLVVFGGTGDLARRKLLPAMFQRWKDGQIPEGARILGTAVDALDTDAYRALTMQAVRAHSGGASEPDEVIARFAAICSYVRTDATSDAGWSVLGDALAGREDCVRVFYMAVAPRFFGPICEQLGRAELVTARSRVVIEKPLGRDLASSIVVNDAVGRVFAESQVFRIDHYLGKETVQNLMALRFGNSLFEPLWNSGHVDHVQITVAEDIGVGSRGGYYETAGAMRDMVQNHLLQLLCLVAMEPPESYGAHSVRDEKLKVLKALRRIDGEAAAQRTVRGQYTALKGAADVPGYREEANVERSETETFVAIKAEVANWRWAGVPFYLRTGKRMPTRVSEIVVAFRPIPHSIFAESSGTLQSNKLVIRLQPDEGVTVWMMIKDPGPGGMRLRYVPLDMSFAEAFGVRQPDAYERLLMDVVRGDQTLFMRRDEVEAAWRWVDPIIEAWSRDGSAPQAYTAGTWGPSKAIALIERDGRTWHEDTV